MTLVDGLTAHLVDEFCSDRRTALDRSEVVDLVIDIDLMDSNLLWTALSGFESVAYGQRLDDEGHNVAANN